MTDAWPGTPVDTAQTEQWPGKPVESQTTSEPKRDLAWADVGKSALVNAPASALEFGKNLVQPILHPIDTATAIKNVGQGALEKAGVLSGTEHVPYADAFGKFFVDRYGSIENAKHTLAHDPVGVAADLSALLTGGETALARIPGLAKAAEVAGTAARAVDPLTAAGKVVTGAGKLVAEPLGVMTGTGGESIRAAAGAGYRGGQEATAFQESMRGATSMEDVVTEAKTALRNMRQQRSVAYKAGMAGVTDPTVLDFAKIDKALHDAQLVKTYKGQNLSPKTEAAAKELMDTVNDWRKLDPAEYHTAEGLDALKQKLGDIRDGTQFGTPERVAADKVYNAIRQTIIDQVPEYAKVMKGYEEASKQIKEIEKTLSLNPNASVDTSLRKLQSVLRNNVNANYGRRAQLAEFLVNAGAPHLMQKLSGQMLTSWTPRGLGKLAMQMAMELGAMGLGAHAAGFGGAGMAAAATLPLMMPRLVGEGAYYTGKIAGAPGVRPAGTAIYRAGQADQQRARGGAVKAFHPKHLGAKRAKDGKWYMTDPDRPGKYLRVDRHARV